MQPSQMEKVATAEILWAQSCLTQWHIMTLCNLFFFWVCACTWLCACTWVCACTWLCACTWVFLRHVQNFAKESYFCPVFFLVKWSHPSTFLHGSAWKPVKLSPEGEVPPSGTTSCSLLCGSVTAYCTGPDHLNLLLLGLDTQVDVRSSSLIIILLLSPVCVFLQLTYNHLAIITCLCSSPAQL